MQMEGRGDNHHSWDRIPLFLAKNNLYGIVSGFTTINYKTRNLRVQFPPSVKDKLKEIIYQWGQEHPWDPLRQKDALREALVSFDRIRQTIEAGMPEDLLTKKGVYAYLLMGGDTFDMKKGSGGWTVTVKNAKVKDDRQVVIVDSEAGVKYVLSM